MDDIVWIHLYLAMAAIYFADSLFYFAAWVVDTKNRMDHGLTEHLIWDVAAWAEIMYVVSALFGLIAAGLSYPPFTDPDASFLVRTFQAIISFEFYLSMLLVSNVCYALDAALYWSAWYNKRRLQTGTPLAFWKDPYFWADGVFLTIPSLGYMVTSFVAVGYAYDVFSKAESFPVAIRVFRSVLSDARRWNFAFDILYVIDAGLYVWGWVVDGRVRAAQLKEDQEIISVLGPEYKMT